MTRTPAAGPAAPAEPAVREQLERVLASAQFAPAPGAGRLLRFLVEEQLAGRGEQLKEYTLAVEVFGRDASFDPKIDPAVRVEASRLRRRLERYYLTVGRDDPVLIELPRGYRPSFSHNADVLHLRRDLDGARAGRTRDAAAVPLGHGPWIAVLPFDCPVGEADVRFGDGLTVEVVTALSRFREFHVLGSDSVFRHRGGRDPAMLRRELGADYVVTGHVQRADDRLRVHAQLLSAPRGQVLWAESYDRDLNTAAILEVQGDIAVRIVAAIAQPHGMIARPELARAKRRPPGRLDSYECLLLFYEYAANRSPERHRRLRDAVNAALAEEAGIARLWSVASFVAQDTARFGYNAEQGRESALEEALRAARRAVRIDPADALGYHALFLAHFARGDWKAFRKAGDRALELNPHHADILADYGLHLTMCDQWTPGRLLLKAALTLNPEPPDWYWFPHFGWHFERGEFDEALDMALRAQSQEFFWTHAMHAMAYRALGMQREAAAAVERLLATYPGFPAVAREELGRWVGPERVAPALEALRGAGLPEGVASA